jgi:predicted aspartyl protease
MMRETAAMMVWALGVWQVQVLPSAAAPSPAEWTPFTLGDQGGIVVPATLNGVGPFRLLLDTGATHSSISEDVARTLGAPLVATTTVTTTTGSEVQGVVRLDRFELGPLRIEGLQPSVAAMQAIDATGTVQGVIGQDVLATAAYTIEFDRRRITWGRDAAAPAGPTSVFSLEFIEGRFVVELPQRDRALRLVPDTGSGTIVLFDSPGPAPVSTSGLDGVTGLATLTGRALVQQVRLRELRIGATTWRDVTAVLIQKPAGNRAGADGLLPLHGFRRVTFDGPRGLLAVLD